MDEAKLAEIEARANAATPGPWRAGSVVSEGRVWAPYAGALEGPHGERCIFIANTHFPHTTDREFVAHARTDVPDLVAEVRRLTAALAITRGDLGDANALADLHIAHLRAEHAAALEIARREGAEAMRERAARMLRTMAPAMATASEAEHCLVAAEMVAALPLDAPGGES